MTVTRFLFAWPVCNQLRLASETTYAKEKSGRISRSCHMGYRNYRLSSLMAAPPEAARLRSITSAEVTLICLMVITYGLST